jgi:hypothetical protein
MERPRLPKAVEGEPIAAQLATELAKRARPLWKGGRLRVARAELAPGLETALRSVYSAGQIVRGLEAADRSLKTQARGLARVDRKTGVERGRRVSRLLVLADDGSERFYRNVESLVHLHAPRVLALRLAIDERALGELVFGPDQVARLLLIEHKHAVSALLLELAVVWSEETRRPRRS